MAGKKPEIDQGDSEPRHSGVDAVYAERNKLVALVYKMALQLGCTVGIREDKAEPDWPVVFIDLPSGQVSWHIQQKELVYFEEAGGKVRAYESEYDGHSTEEKYERVLKYGR